MQGDDVSLAPANRKAQVPHVESGFVMYDLAGEHGLDREAFRTRLRRMNDRDLLRFGKSAHYMCSRIVVV
jgi:hypothetical protein